MGLHHRFPSYFYEAGNLFNTYLGYTALVEAPSRLERTGRKARKPPVANTGLPDSSKSTPGVEQFSRFVEKHLTPDDAERLLHLLATDAGVELDLSTSPRWSMVMKLTYFAEQHLTDSKAGKFASALEERRAAGEPMVQK